MIDYYVLLKISAPDSEFFIEIGLDYKLPFHPNLTDEITVAGIECEIKSIRYDLDDIHPITLRVDGYFSYVRSGLSPREIHEIMQSQWNSLLNWTQSNNERIILNDYFMDPSEDYREDP